MKKQLTKEQADRLFIRSVKTDNVRALEKSISQGADPNQFSEHFRDFVNDKTALMYALSRGQSEETINCLIKAGADLSYGVMKLAGILIKSSRPDLRQRGQLIMDAYIEQQKRLAADSAIEACQVSLMDLSRESSSKASRSI